MARHHDIGPMMQSNGVIDRLRSKGLMLPSAPQPSGSYVPYVRSGSLLYVAGQTCLEDGQLRYRGTVGGDISLADGRQAAAVCALNVLSIVGLACSANFERVRAIRLTGFIRCVADFDRQTAVLDGASDVFLLALGERGRHVRAALGVHALPRGAPVEVEATFELL